MPRTKLLLALVFIGIALPAVAFAGALVDPATNPGGFLDQLIGFAHTSWPIAVGLGVYGLLELLADLGKEGGKLAWFGTGRVSLVIAGAIGVLGAALNAYLGGGNAQAALVAAVVALAAYWHPKAPAAVGIEPAELPRARALLAQPRGIVQRGLIFGLATVALGGGLMLACGAQSKKALADLGHCSESAAWNDLKPTVQSILESVSNWKAQLEALGVKFGEDELICAVSSVEEVFAAKIGAAPDAASAAVAVAARARAEEFLREHGVKQ